MNSILFRFKLYNLFFEFFFKYLNFTSFTNKILTFYDLNLSGHLILDEFYCFENIFTEITFNRIKKK